MQKAPNRNLVERWVMGQGRTLNFGADLDHLLLNSPEVWFMLFDTGLGGGLHALSLSLSAPPVPNLHFNIFGQIFQFKQDEHRRSIERYLLC